MMMSTMGMIHHFWSKKVKRLKNNKIINYFFNSYFRLISQCFYSNFKWKYSLDAKFNSSSKEYLCCILSMDPATWKMWLQSIFFMYFSFLYSRVHRKYETWVLIGWKIKIFIQRIIPPEIWVKNLGDKLKIYFYTGFPKNLR